MPTVFREGEFRFYFFSNEGSPREPRHVHVQSGEKAAKYWLEPDILLAEAWGFGPADLRRIEGILDRRAHLIAEAWDAHFGS